MDCLKQFQFGIGAARTYSTASSNFATWTNAGQNFWIVQSTADITQFEIQGFKNINLYGVKMQGFVQSPISGNFGIVEDYSYNLKLTGQKPSLSGVFTTNNWNADLYPIDLRLTKFENEIMFSEPIKSLTNIRLSNFNVQGYGNSSLLNIKLDIEFNFYFLYKFEGEDENY